MAAASFSLFISYSQVAVFDSALEHPFNLWTERHVQQGFSWRPGSVSFATLEEAGQHDIEIDVVPDDVALSPEAIRTIQTPFEVPQSGSIELASISESIPLSLASGPYLLRFEYFLATGGLKPRIRFVFIRNGIAAFKIMRADPELKAIDDLLLSAEPA
jgi:Competence protein J (ComJ)